MAVVSVMKTEEFRLAGKLTIVSVVKNAMLASPLTSLCNEGCQAGWSVSCCSGSKECHAGWPIS